MLADEVSQIHSEPETPADPRFALDNFGENSDDFA
jgi:hypothetical protein